jgi:Cd2+/Zn2+-exporting ATPase/Cu+-exporting ATPase
LEEPERFDYIPGKGVIVFFRGSEILAGTRNLLEERSGIAIPASRNDADVSEVFVASRGEFLGTIRISDVLRSEAKQAVAELKEQGIQTVLLTGDSKQAAKAVAEQLGVDETAAELLPEQKLQWVRDLRAQGRRVAMVGDGINDAPALAQATVGIAMGSGTDVARESADIILIGNDLTRLVETIRVARRCRGIILQNFVGTLTVDSIGVGLAAFGMLNPLLAAFIHVTSELSFILNSARLLPGSAARK